MKKLKLRLEGMKEMLTKEQMKKINGGYSGYGHFEIDCYCNGNFAINIPANSCLNAYSDCDQWFNFGGTITCTDISYNCFPGD